MLKWLTFRKYNLMDVMWLILASRAAIDRRWLTMLCILVIGAVTSRVLEAIQAKRSMPSREE